MYQAVRSAQVAFGREAMRNVTDLAIICLEMIVRATRLHEITKKKKRERERRRRRKVSCPGRKDFGEHTDF